MVGLELVETLEDSDRRAALEAIADSLSGPTAFLDSVVDQVLDKGQDPSLAGGIADTLVTRLLAQGEVEQALKVVPFVVGTLPVIVHEFVSRGHGDRLIETSRALPDAEDQAGWLSAIARRLASTGDARKARIVLDEARDRLARVDAPGDWLLLATEIHATERYVNQATS